MSLIYPYPTSIDGVSIDSAIKQLKDNEKLDDDAVAALETLLKAKDVELDKAIADLKARVDAIPTTLQDSSVTALFDPLPTPTPSQVLSGSGATATPATTGSLLVNQGKTHTTSRTTAPPLIAWESTMTISPVMGECRVRWAILTVKQGTLEIQLGTAPAIQASNTGIGWTCADPTVTIWVDGNYTCFDRLIPTQASPLSVRFQLPTGPSVVQLPSLYSPSTPFSLIPADPTAIKLTDLSTGKAMIYRPTDFVKPVDLPKPFDPTSLTNRVYDLEARPALGPDGVVAFSYEGNLTTQLNSAHFSGGTFKDWVMEVEGNAIDISLGSNTSAATLKNEIGLDPTTTVIRIKAGIADALISNSSTIPTGLYRIWQAGGQLRMRVLDSV
ncbi:MAG: hypothetical protein ACRC62_04840 [Microcoleus sp.]